MLHALDGIVLSVDHAALLNDRLLAPPWTDHAV